MRRPPDWLYDRTGFYKGRIAKAILAALDEEKGVMTADDLAQHRSTVTRPIHTTYRGYTIYEVPPPTQVRLSFQVLTGAELAEDTLPDLRSECLQCGSQRQCRLTELEATDASRGWPQGTGQHPICMAAACGVRAETMARLSRACISQAESRAGRGRADGHELAGAGGGPERHGVGVPAAPACSHRVHAPGLCGHAAIQCRP